MQIQDYKSPSSYHLPPKTANRMVKIKDLVSRALEEVRLFDEDVCLEKKIVQLSFKKE
jgi:hypothetical protein